MLKQLLLPLTLTTAFALPMATPAQASDDCGMSYMILPDGRCLPLDYVSLLGASRRNVGEGSRIYEELFETNVELETIYNRFPELNRETEAQRETRYETLAIVGEGRDAIASGGLVVEDRMFPIHVRAMYIVGEAFRR